MSALISLLVVVTFSLIIVRVGTVALTMTGLSRQIAQFQAQSAFSGVGFTTSEAEQVVNHPARRRIIRILILLGNAGIISAIASLFLSFTSAQTGGERLIRLGLISGGLAILWLIAHSAWIDRHISKWIRSALTRWTDLKLYDYEQLLKLRSGYAVSNLLVEDNDWLADRKLADLQLNHEGILVLGVERKDGSYIGTPKGTTVLRVGDVVTCYGRKDALRRLSERPSGAKGEQQHREAEAEQQRIRDKEAKLDQGG